MDTHVKCVHIVFLPHVGSGDCNAAEIIAKLRLNDLNAYTC